MRAPAISTPCPRHCRSTALFMSPSTLGTIISATRGSLPSLAFYSLFDFSCTPSTPHSCTSCRLGKHVRQPFKNSTYVSPAPFCLLHCDVWTSPVLSHSGCQYYLVVLDDYSHYVWTFPLRHKSDILPTLVSFHAFVQTQFGRPILAFQTDNGGEFVNTAFRSFLCGVYVRPLDVNTKSCIVILILFHLADTIVSDLLRQIPGKERALGAAASAPTNDYQKALLKEGSY